MSDNEKTIQSINTDDVKGKDGKPLSMEERKTIHNFGEAMGQVAQAHKIEKLGGDEGPPPISFEDAVLAKQARDFLPTQEAMETIPGVSGHDHPEIRAALEKEAAEDRWAGLARMNPPGTKPKSAQHLFDELLPLRFHQAPEKAEEFGNLVYSFVVSDEGGGTWTMFLGTTPRVEKGKHPHANCTVELSHQHFMDLVTGGGASAMSLFMQGRVKISGDPMMAMKLSKLAKLF
jgi:putative sterol carrier protein